MGRYIRISDISYRLAHSVHHEPRPPPHETPCPPLGCRGERCPLKRDFFTPDERILNVHPYLTGGVQRYLTSVGVPPPSL